MEKGMIVKELAMIFVALLLFTFSQNLLACTNLKLTYTYEIMRNIQADSQEITNTCSRSDNMLSCYSALTQELNRTYEPLIADLPESCREIISGYASSTFNRNGGNSTATGKQSESTFPTVENTTLASRLERPILHQAPSFPW